MSHYGCQRILVLFTLCFEAIYDHLSCLFRRLGLLQVLHFQFQTSRPTSSRLARLISALRISSPGRCFFDAFEMDVKKNDFRDLVVNNQTFMTFVEIRRPKETRNAIAANTWEEIETLFTYLKYDPDTRTVLLYSGNADFVGAIEEGDIASGIVAPARNGNLDPARRGNLMGKTMALSQNACNAIANCGKPVILAIHGKCVGAGMDLATACDIRYSTEAARFKFKDMTLGIASHSGSIARLHKLTGKTGFLSEMLFSGGYFTGALASRCGFVSKTFPDQQTLFDAAKKLAYRIAWQNPIEIMAAKSGLDFASEHSTGDTRIHAVMMSMSQILCDDFLLFEETAKKKDRYAKTDYAPVSCFPPSAFYASKPQKGGLKTIDRTPQTLTGRPMPPISSVIRTFPEEPTERAKTKKSKKREDFKGEPGAPVCRLEDDEPSKSKHNSVRKVDDESSRKAKSKKKDEDEPSTKKTAIGKSANQRIPESPRKTEKAPRKSNRKKPAKEDEAKSIVGSSMRPISKHADVQSAKSGKSSKSRKPK
ncbi:hypothetical protein L596_008648 [Steinernema carpocapsae]|uniref:Enoyl-CoA hydratase n=1 Tax=Steinernema carpocapsae TaxID=34508 RepID=A0A4V6A6C9_STECR|nr:hypothetical protein L596_008648 [Steinernema carpocapsae]